MSGIAGIYYLDNRPVDREDLEKMADIQVHRGPDGSGVWQHGAVGLSHRMLWTTPESLQEKLPLVNQAGDLAITADARIDNRDELIARLNLTGHPRGSVTDSQLILAAYERWGDRCPEMLLGDFAFAIWDGCKQSLFCARDHFGIRPLYYYKSDRVFVFGSEIKALFCLAEVPRRLNELRVGYHLAETVEDNAVTFYQGVFRLPAAHSLRVGHDGLNLRAYWSLDPRREVHFGSDEEYAEAFRELFTEAVRCRLRSAYPVGSMLSGGLDSSAVTCVARDLLVQNGGQPLHTVSAIYDHTPESDERSFITAVLDQGNVKPHFVKIDSLSPLHDLERVHWLGDEPLSSPTFYIVWALCRAAHEQGVRVLLDGIDGDTAVSHGDGYLAELARTGRWADFSLEAKALAQHENLASGPALLQHYGLSYLTELAQEHKWRTFARHANEISRHYDVSRRKLYWRYGLSPLAPKAVRRMWHVLRGQNGHQEKCEAIINQEFAKRISLDEHIESVASHGLTRPQNDREMQHRALSSGIMPFVFELANRTSTAFSIEARHPFSDRRLLEFCLALPPEQKLRRGWNRVILRRALDGVLPEEIQWRGGKTLNSAAFTRGLLGFEGMLLKEVAVDDSGSLKPYVDVFALRDVYRRYLSQRNPRDEMKVWQAVTLALWLRHTNLADLAQRQPAPGRLSIDGQESPQLFGRLS